MADKNLDFTHLSEDEKINGINITNVPQYIREKAYLTDFSETLAQLAEMIIQLGFNLSLDPDEALEWARKLQQAVPQSEFDSWIATLLDGGPSIFMNTLSELQTTYPNGAAGVALVRETDPAKIYVWNGTAWEDFGAYQGIEVKDGSITSSKIAESAVTPSKTEHLVKNLLNPQTTIFPYVLNTDGSVTENSSGYYVSDFIPVMPGMTYWLTRSRVNLLMVQYDANESPLSYVNGTGTAGTNNPYLYKPANPNVRFVRVQYSRYVDTPETFMMIEGQYHPDDFIPYEKYYIQNMYYNESKLPAYKPLKGRKIAFVGDSITAADGTTPAYASESIKGYQSYVKDLGADVTSLHYAGATYRKYDANISDSTHPSLYTAINLNNEWDFSSYDTICLMAGSNDVGRGPNFGTVDSRDSGTTFGALNLIIEYIIQANPNVKIILFTPPQRKREGTTHVPDLWTKLLELCVGFEEIGANYGVKTVNLVKEGGIGFANLNSTLYDVVHPNNLGHELISKAIVANL